MLAIRRILYPTDFSDGATRAFPQAVYLANRHDADLHIVNVSEPGGNAGTTLPAKPGTLRQWLDTTGIDAGTLVDLSIVQKQVGSGVPAERLVAYVEDRDIDVVVMGTHGRRGVRRMLLGSVTEEVVRKAACPVLTVRADSEQKAGATVRRVLVPVDFSEAAQTAVRHATEIARTYDGAEVHLLHVVEEVVYPSAYGVNPPYEASQVVVGRVEAALGKMVREGLGDEQVRVSATVGYAPLTILDYVEEHGIDLVVIATHGRSGLDRVLLGSVAERVLRRSPVPVFVVKPDHKSLVPAAEEEAAARN